MKKAFNIQFRSKALLGFLCFLVVIGLVFTTLIMSSCNGSSGSGQSESTQGSTGSGSSDASNASNTSSTSTARFLNFNPEVAKMMADAAALYKQETGNEIIVDTAANGQYQTTLSAKMSTNEAPTLFVLGGQKDLTSWKNYITDITDSWANKHLLDPNSSLKGVDGKVYGVPYHNEGYGIIYNKKIAQAYFNLPDRATNINSMEEIKSFDQLKAVTEDMQAHKDELGIQGAFASTSLKTGHEFRWQTHLLNVPITKEFQDNNVNLSSNDIKSIEFKYNKNYQQLFDLYLNNSIVDRKRAGTIAVTDSMAEFALGKCAMVQNGNWSWNQIKAVKNKKVDAEDVAFLPLYMGLPNEETQGLCIGTENYFVLNSKSTQAQRDNAMHFIEWLFSSPTGKDIVCNQMGFIAPFDTFSETDVPADPLGKQLMQWMHRTDVQNMPWYFTVFPSQNFKNRVGQKLLRYAQGQRTWDEVAQYTTDLWYTEYNQDLYGKNTDSNN